MYWQIFTPETQIMSEVLQLVVDAVELSLKQGVSESDESLQYRV
jgi:hypothetical protein